jgi:hypothetical protein
MEFTLAYITPEYQLIASMGFFLIAGSRGHRKSGFDVDLPQIRRTPAVRCYCLLRNVPRNTTRNHLHLDSNFLYDASGSLLMARVLCLVH